MPFYIPALPHFIDCVFVAYILCLAFLCIVFFIFLCLAFILEFYRGGGK